ncbi:MAG: type II toxin-antitoxin system RelE/ParE family toxin [bacterium]|nr:type II toxin-antitoxin system RelE/ParE family toxin [bacterium]
MTRIRLSVAAKRDVREVQEWYATQKPDLDLEFRDELERTLGHIRAFPESCAVVYKDVRRANLHRFPYGVFYHRRKNDLFVLAIMHHARHPRHWQRRR